MNEGGYCWNSGQVAGKADTILREINTHLPETVPLLTQIGEAWNTAEREQVLDETFPRMPKGSIDYKVMQRTNNACSILLPCTWEDMGTHASVTEKIGKIQQGNLIAGRAVVTVQDHRVFCPAMGKTLPDGRVAAPVRRGVSRCSGAPMPRR